MSQENIQNNDNQEEIFIRSVFLSSSLESYLVNKKILAS